MVARWRHFSTFSYWVDKIWADINGGNERNKGTVNFENNTLNRKTWNNLLILKKYYISRSREN